MLFTNNKKEKALQILRDIRARQHLHRILWEASHGDELGRPYPGNYSDDEIKKELKRILIGK